VNLRQQGASLAKPPSQAGLTGGEQIRSVGSDQLTGPRTDLGRRLGIRWPRCCTRAGGGGNRRRAAARGGCGARVPHLSRVSHRHNGELTAISTAGSQGGGEGLGRRTVTRRGGAAPVTSPRRSGVRRRKQPIPTVSLPRDGTTGELDGGGRTAGARLRRRQR
jgi:hypothetical protein